MLIHFMYGKDNYNVAQNPRIYLFIFLCFYITICMTCNTGIQLSDLSSIYGKENFDVAYRPRIYLISL